jgi:hypothetical protein
LAIAAVAALLLSGCSPEVGLPAVHDMPPPRTEAPLTPDQIKKATEELANEREHLSTATQSSSQANPPTAKKAVADARKKPLATTPTAARTRAPNGGQTAGSDTKP